jgi:vacuolar-type H+-ATPase subunit E/Vma4
MGAKAKRGSATGWLTGPDDDEPSARWVLQEEQPLIDSIVHGEANGQYHLLVGEKGTGKLSMLLDAMASIDGEGCAIFYAHADLEVFRIRLGNALDFEFHEDNIGSLFSIRGPRNASALLDVERAFNKLEEVALKRRNEAGKPLILILNCMHLIRDNDEGRDLLELVQQRAELWAASNLATVIFNSDDYWIYERLKQYATRMNVIQVLDLNKPKAISALAQYRRKYREEIPDMQILEQVYNKVGGRLSYLGQIAKSDDMLKTANDICQMEKTWFLNQCWIHGREMDDDVIAQQKYALAAMVLAKTLVDMEKEMETTYDPEKGHILPQMQLHKARQVMTRGDFLQSYDSINIFTIDSNAMVRADSVPMMNAFRETCSEEGFNEFLEATMDRISDIESLGRMRELTIKELGHGAEYIVKTTDTRGRETGGLTFQVA